MTPEQQTPASVVEREPVSNPYKLVGASKAFLTEAARYFEARPTGGEDAAHWSNVFNAKNCREAADMIERLSAEREGLAKALGLPSVRHSLDRLTFSNCTVAEWKIVSGARAALSAQGESRQTGWIDHDGGPNPVPGQQVEDVVWKAEGASAGLTLDNIDWRQVTAYRIALPAAPTPADGGGE